MLLLRAGSSFIAEVKIQDLASVPPTAFSPDSVQISIINSNGVTVVNLASMTLSSVTGYYTYIGTTNVFLTSGVYTCFFKITEGSEVYYSHTFVIFKLTDADITGSVAIFDYFILKDSSNVSWYFSIGSSSVDAGDMHFNLIDVTPTDTYLTARNITPVSIPNYLVGLDELGNTKYIYPDTNGQITVDTALPTGTAWNISAGLSVIGRDRVTYIYSPTSYLSALLTPTSYPAI